MSVDERASSEKLFRLSLQAMSASRHDDAMEFLETLLEREPEHALGNYLFAAQLAQLGMLDRAEPGFRKAMILAGSDFPMPRFQLGQLLMVQGRPDEVMDVLLPLERAPDPALRAYVNAFIALARQQRAVAIESLHEGLKYEQVIPVLANDMRSLLTDLEHGSSVPDDEVLALQSPAVSMLLSNYEKH